MLEGLLLCNLKKGISLWYFESSFALPFGTSIFKRREWTPVYISHPVELDLMPSEKL